ncbi:MAG TPA: prephenate dehydratase, partial [Acidimicrobiaceae bacterium]|nr:prephenate dehydratase [Acidimicrobiaceae bacterium]
MGENKRLAYLGPAGTFTEHALLNQPDLKELDLVSVASIPEVLKQVSNSEADLGFVAIENSIEGSVNITQDTLTFDADLLIQREVVESIELNLLALPDTALDQITNVLSFPHAIAQCRDWLSVNLSNAVTEAANSTADAARNISENLQKGFASIGTARAADA